MSSYTVKAKNLETGETVSVFCHDDYFGRHDYGYQPEDKAGYLTEEQFRKQYEEISNG